MGNKAKGESVEVVQLLIDSIPVYEVILNRLKSMCEKFCEMFDLYEKTMLVIAELPYWEDKDSSHKTVNLKMLELITEEMQILGHLFEGATTGIERDKTNLLPYVRDVEESLYILLTSGKVHHILADEFFYEQEDAYGNARIIFDWLLHTVKIYRRIVYRAPEWGTAQKLFPTLVSDYESLNLRKLDFWMDHLTGNINEEKKKLDDEYRDTPAVNSWFEAGGDIEIAILKMYEQNCVERDLLPLLEYKAKYDRLTAREKGEEQPKKAGEANSTIMSDDERAKRAIQAALDNQVAGEYVFEQKNQWTGVLLVLRLERLYSGTNMGFADYLKRLGFDDPRVGLPNKDSIIGKVCNKVVSFEEWQISGNTSSTERSIYDVAKIVKEELEKTAKKT